MAETSQLGPQVIHGDKEDVLLLGIQVAGPEEGCEAGYGRQERRTGVMESRAVHRRRTVVLRRRTAVLRRRTAVRLYYLGRCTTVCLGGMRRTAVRLCWVFHGGLIKVETHRRASLRWRRTAVRLYGS